MICSRGAAKCQNEWLHDANGSKTGAKGGLWSSTMCTLVWHLRMAFTLGTNVQEVLWVWPCVLLLHLSYHAFKKWCQVMLVHLWLLCVWNKLVWFACNIPNCFSGWLNAKLRHKGCGRAFWRAVVSCEQSLNRGERSALLLLYFLNFVCKTIIRKETVIAKLIKSGSWGEKSRKSFLKAKSVNYIIKMSYVPFMKNCQLFGANRFNERDVELKLQWSTIFKHCSSQENVITSREDTETRRKVLIMG